MDFEEGLAWLRGERSTRNYADSSESADIRDAAMMQQAYWIVRAWREGLV